ncbi:MAG: hypothetical protein V3W19_17960, partial [Desulfatiglandales bacterium]
KGSRVIRGNLLAIPLGDTFIYVEPVYLEARQEESEVPATRAPQQRGFGKRQRGATPASSQRDESRAASIPELKRVIVAFGSRLIMEESLDKALRGVLGGEVFPEQLASPSFAQTEGISDLGVLALKHYNNAKNYLRQGNWAGYGRELENLEKVLKEISSKRQEKK